MSQSSGVQVNNTCYCARMAIMKTSWTDLNPGRRFAICPKYKQIGGCKYYVWIDPPMCDRSRNIIPGLLRNINKYEDELKKYGVELKKCEDELKKCEDDLKKCEEQLIKKGAREKWLWIALTIAMFLVYLLV
ncbi:PREDICTED: uncharacterized protein LOC105949220 [Erythranthe guttata]|uniref:uncharacterized protein LOC105949220 n=1 Tax=Erythranthe guttata TaxID=4155 RepID=UPI00064D9C6E|nr:PREDICTED: uncharacterized protein LOC105949220 [Erythranthe guttata]|eukprot:XP_012827969.1 PREDICTED: uncharacterized protein LOC105949220 [Erythranthe guttata]